MLRILAIDGSSLARSRYEAGSLPGGFIAKLFDLWELDPALVYLAWDHPQGSSRRKEICPDYKAKRPPKPPAYLAGVAELREALPWLGVFQLESTQGEADDVLATIARTCPGPMVIYTADKDMLQLVGPGVDLLRAGVGPRADEMITAANIRESRIKYGNTEITGLDATGWLDLQALAGDGGDGVKGVPGIGPKKALQLLGNRELLWKVIGGSPAPCIDKTLRKLEGQLEAFSKAYDLVRLYTLERHELIVMPANPRPLRAAKWLEQRGLGYLTERMPYGSPV